MSDSVDGETRSPKLAPIGGMGLGMAGGVLSGIRSRNAPRLERAPPQVDSLAVRVVTDSYLHNFEPSGEFAGVRVQRFALPLTTEPPGPNLLCEWGLSLYIESTRAAEKRRLLVDFGYTSTALNNNVALLGIDPASFDAMLLTHGHFDHFGGMAGFLAAHRQALTADLPFYLGGEECFCAREAGPADTPRNFGVLSRRAIAEAKLLVLFAQHPTVIADHGFTTGWIPLVSFERPAQPTRMTVGMQPDGEGCAPEGLPEEKRTVRKMTDDFQHEQAACYDLKGKGLVVITSCGHRGIVNTVRAAMKVSGLSKVHAILGGFHLMPLSEEYARETVMAIKELEPDVLIPMHCSGETFFEIAKQQMPGRVIRTSAGTIFTFGASGGGT